MLKETVTEDNKGRGGVWEDDMNAELQSKENKAKRNAENS